MKKQWEKYFLKGCFVIILSCTLLSCKTKEVPPNESPGFPSRIEIPFEIVAQGVHGNFKEPKEIQIASQGELNEIYQSINRDLIPNLESPIIDFSNYWIGFVTLGEKPTGGYALTVKNVVRSGYQTTVELESSAPEGMATMALTSPYIIFKIAKQANAMKFIYSETQKER